MSLLSLLRLWLWVSALATTAGWLLSATRQLNVRGYSLFCAITLVVVWIYRKYVSKSPAILHPPSSILAVLRSRFRRPLPLSFAILALLILLGGFLYPSNNHTALSYRLPRVLHWLAEGRWHWIHTANYRMNDRACGIEWLSAPLMLFTRSDRLLFLLNFIPYLMLPGLIFSVWTRLGVRPRVAWHWMWLMPTGYTFLLQAGSAGNDTFPTVYALAAIDFAFRARESRRLSDLSYSIQAAALLTGAKASNIPLLLPWVILVITFFIEGGRRERATQLPLGRSLENGLLSPTLSSKRGEGEDPQGSSEKRPNSTTAQGEGESSLASSSFEPLNLFKSFFRGVLATAREHRFAPPALLLVACLISFLPTAYLNHYYIHDWSGLSLERPGMDMKNPIIGLWGNALILLFNNFLFTFFPFARWWNAHALTWLPHAIVSPMVANFEGGFHIVGEMPTEDYSGVGFGLSFLALVSLLASFFHRNLTLNQNLNHHSNLYRFLLVAPWLALAAYCMKSGMVTGARLIAPYYPLLFPLLLAGSTQSQVVRKRWWQIVMWFGLLLALATLALAPARPLWPARTILTRSFERHSARSSLGRALSVYTVYSQRSDPLANVRNLLPPGGSTVGFMATEDDIEISFWRPYSSRRVKDLLLTDSAQYIRDQNVQYIVIGDLNFTLHQTTLDDWLARTDAKLIATTSATLKVAEGGQPWYVVRID